MIKTCLWLIKKLTQGIAMLLFALFAFVLYLLFTQSGSEKLLSIISEVSPYRFEYDHFSGYLARQAHFEGLRIKGPRLYAKASQLEARWTLVDLLRPIKTLEYFNAKELVLQYEGKKIDAASAQVLLPFPFIVENLTLHQAHFNIHDEVHDVTYLHLKQANSTQFDALQEIHYEGSLGKFDAILNTELQASWDLHFHEAPFIKQYLQGTVKSQGNISLPKRKWRDPNNEINITVTGDQFHFENVTLNQYTLKINGTLAKHEAKLQGKINKIDFESQCNGKLSPSRFEAKITQLNLQSPVYEALEKTTGQLTIDWSKKLIHAQLKLLLGQTQPVETTLQIQKNSPYSLKGKVNMKLNQLKLLSAWFPEFKRWKGEGEVNLNLSGSLKNIQTSGDLLLRDLKGSTRFLKNKAHIEKLHLSISKKQKISLSGQGMLGSGLFHIQGEGSLDKKEPYLNIHLKGEQLLLSDTPEYYIVANPDLTLSLKNSGPLLQGNIFIPHAEIKSFKNPETLTPSEDVKIISKKIAQKPSYTYSLSHLLKSNITITLGDKILYEGHGIKTKAKGQINIKQSPGQPIKAKGRITLVKGKYRAYGKRFDISEGELLFTGGVIDNPTLNIRAERKIKVSPSVKSFHAQNEIKAGVRFVGPLKDSRLEFYSSPALSTADIISYLVVGQPQSEVSQSQAGILLEALTQLTLFSGKKRSDVQLTLAEQLKLDQFSISKKEGKSIAGHSPFEDTVLVLGKELSDRLYLHYSLGLMDSSNSIGFRYFVNKNITLEASTGTEGSSADLLLTFEGH